MGGRGAEREKTRQDYFIVKLAAHNNRNEHPSNSNSHRFTPAFSALCLLILEYKKKKEKRSSR